MTRTKKALFSLVPLVVLLCVSELTLTVLGVEPLLAEEDPYVGFSSYVDLFTEEAGPSGERFRVTARNKLRFFNLQRFPEAKGDDAYRIFCLGGSTTYGRPYDDTTSFCGWLRELLPRADSSRDWQVINAGGISYASYRVVKLMQELADYRPDLFVIYTGQNEFLEKRTYGRLSRTPSIVRRMTLWLSGTRTYSAMARLLRGSAPVEDGRELLPEEVETLLDRSVGPEAYHRDDAFRADVLQHFRHNLDRAAEAANASGAEVILIAPASNLRSCSPFRSQHREGLTAEEQGRFARLFSEAQKADKPAEALAALDEAATIDDRFAHLHYARGRALVALGRRSEARQAFERALDEDVCPLRALEPMGEIVRQVAREQNAPLVDFQALLDERAEDGIPGDDLFLDHVHPTIEANLLLAVELIETMRRNGQVDLVPQWGQGTVDSVRREVESRLDPAAHGRALGNLAKVLGWAGKAAEAARAAERATELAPDDPEAHYNLGLLFVRAGRAEQAAQAFETAVALRPGYVEAHYDLALLKQVAGDLTGAAAGYERALQLRPDYPEAHNNLGVVRELAGDVERARSHYERAIALRPDDADAHHNLGVLLRRRGRPAEALPEIEKAIELRPDDPDPRCSMGAVLVQLGRLEQAAAAYEAALSLRPDDAAAHNDLGLVLARQGKLDAAIAQFEEAIRLRPDFGPALENLRVAQSGSKNRN